MANPLYIENNVENVQQGRALRTRYPIYGGTSTTGRTQIPVPLPVYTTIESAVIAAATATTQPFITLPNDGATYKLVAVAARWSTASASGTVTVETAATTVAPGSGVVQLTGTISTAATANTTVNGVVIASPTVVGNGSSLNLVFAGTQTGLVGLVISLTLQRVS